VSAAPRIVLKAGRERSLERRHPWVFSGAIERVEGDPAMGATVRVAAPDGRFLGWAAYSERSQIRARVWSFVESEWPDDGWFERRLATAIARRAELLGPATNAARLVHAESDGLPGLVVDRYAGVLVVQLLSAGPEARRDAIAAALASLTGAEAILERSDAEVRKLEGLPERSAPMRGRSPTTPVPIVEHTLRFGVDVGEGQKTGFYLDQRDNRARVRGLADGCDVLDAFSYTGGFAIAALAGGARSVVSIDSSALALKLAADNVKLNGFGADRWRALEKDVFAELRALRAAGRQFDLIVLDPPKFAPTAKHAQGASRAYKDVNLNALRLLRPGGWLATFSCSGGVNADLFQKIVAGAAADAGVSATIVERFQAAADHPVRLEFPEGEYLKGLLLRREP
jgi:23S rRNA (cytosine1962-C5)-methyltransferase